MGCDAAGAAPNQCDVPPAAASIKAALALVKFPTSSMGFVPKVSPHRTLRWREMDSNLYGAFRVKWLFWLIASSLFGAGKPFFIPSPTMRFAERAQGVKGPKR